jgi:hypothetical protein
MNNGMPNFTLVTPTVNSLKKIDVSSDFLISFLNVKGNICRWYTEKPSVLFAYQSTSCQKSLHVRLNP